MSDNELGAQSAAEGESACPLVPASAASHDEPELAIEIDPNGQKADEIEVEEVLRPDPPDYMTPGQAENWRFLVKNMPAEMLRSLRG